MRVCLAGPQLPRRRAAGGQPSTGTGPSLAAAADAEAEAERREGGCSEDLQTSRMTRRRAHWPCSTASVGNGPSAFATGQLEVHVRSCRLGGPRSGQDNEFATDTSVLVSVLEAESSYIRAPPICAGGAERSVPTKVSSAVPACSTNRRSAKARHPSDRKICRV